MLNRNVLVLNKNWIAVHVCTVKRAIVLLYQDLARVVTENYEIYDFESWRDLSAMRARFDEVVHTPRYPLLVPKVIVLSRFNRYPPRHVKFNRRNIYLRDNYTCQYCGSQPRKDDLTIDHIVPKSRGGKSVWENVVLACTHCNTHKGNQLIEESGMKTLRRPHRPHWIATLELMPTTRERTLWQKFVDNVYWNSPLTKD